MVYNRWPSVITSYSIHYTKLYDVRKKPKGYGRNARIEGAMTEGQRVLLVEDLTTDGGSKRSFVDAIRETGASCGHTAVIFYYGIFPETVGKLDEHGVT